jgi:hypothetical protein
MAAVALDGDRDGDGDGGGGGDGGDGNNENSVMFHKCLTPKSVTIRSYKQQ